VKAPIARSISWIGVGVSVLPLVPILALNYWLMPRWFPFAGTVVWMGAVLALRHWLTRTQREGLRLVKRGQFAAAIPLFEQAYAQMAARPWIDRNRWWLLGSSSEWSYREMALCNQAFCFGQSGEGQKMRTCYERVLAEFPESVLAATALRMIGAATSRPPRSPNEL
jgi:hypothetical protein